MIVNRQVIKEFSGKIIGTIETDHLGNRIVRDFYGKMIGRYDKKQDVTRDFYGKIIARGDQSSLVLGMHTNKTNNKNDKSKDGKSK